MKIKQWNKPGEQWANIGRHSWNVARLIEMSRGLSVMEVDINHLNVWELYEKVTLRDIVMHMRAVLDADLQYPIILDEDGVLMDGRHRIMKAILNCETTIKVVRFDENPSPCIVGE